MKTLKDLSDKKLREYSHYIGIPKQKFGKEIFKEMKRRGLKQ